MAMMASASSSITFPPPSSTATAITHKYVPLLGLSLSALSLSNNNKLVTVKCTSTTASTPTPTAPKKDLSLVPKEQRWMFDDSNVNGRDIWNNTYYPKAADHVNTDKPWFVVDATDLVLGRLSTVIAVHIRGKNLASYTPSVDMGAFVIVVNAEKVYVSGKKRAQKLYRRHSGRPGGMKVETFDTLQKRIPERIIEHAVRGMLPKGRLGRQLFNHLKVYKGPDHPHEAQQPIPLPLTDKRIRVVREA